MNQKELIESIETMKTTQVEEVDKDNYLENNIDLLPTWVKRLYYMKFILLAICSYLMFVSLFNLLSDSWFGLWMFGLSGLGFLTSMLLDEFCNFIFTNNNKHVYKKGFLYNLKRKIRHEYFCNLYIKNNPKYDPAIDLINTNDPTFINDIYAFYENHPHKFGTQENLHFTLQLEKIRSLYNQGNYNEIISLYKADKIKYEYIQKFNFN